MINETASVSSKAKIGKNVSIGHCSVIYDNVEIGDNTVIESFCEIGYPTKLAKENKLVIGANSHIRSHSIFYEGSTFKEGLMTGHRVTVRENVHAGTNLQVGTLSDFQGDCTFGNHVRTHSNVHVGKYSKVGDFVWMFPYVVLTNDPHPPSDTAMGVTLEDYSVVSTMSVVLPGVTVREHALVGAHSLVNRDVPARMVVAGNPAVIKCETSAIKMRNNKELSAYPWPKHFKRGYPDAIVQAWIKRIWR